MIRETDRGREAVHVWAGVSQQGKAPLVILEPGERWNHATMRRIVDYGIWPASENINQGGANVARHVWDNARPHTSLATREYCEQRGIVNLMWPAKSPDLMVLDFFVWSRMNQDLAKLPKPATRAEHIENIRNAWNNLPMHEIQQAIANYPVRLQKVIESGGRRFI